MVSSILRRLSLLVPFIAVLVCQQAEAVPAFARQTGFDCAACHVGSLGPQLTALGRNFKLGGYTMKKGGDAINVPVSAMLVASYVNTAKAQPAPASPYDNPNNNSAMDQLSVFVAGGFSEHLGAFGQVTYSDISRETAMDNIDIRYAGNTTLFGESVIGGISLNNNPTAQDIWNTVPAWHFPYMSSDLAPAPGAATLINGGLGQQVIGATAYGYFNNMFYIEMGGYTSMSRNYIDNVHAGDPTGKIDGVAPYVRAAFTQNFDSQTLMVGISGLQASIHPDYLNGDKNGYYDTGMDIAYQYTISADHQIAINGSYVHERQALNYAFTNGDSGKRAEHLNEANVNFSYYFQNTYGLTTAWFDTAGTKDIIAFAPNPLDGSRKGVPDSSGYVLQGDWTPFGKSTSWAQPLANLRVGLQYIDYTKFNGGSKNYDGSNRDAKDNNTTYFFIWTAI